MNPSHFPSLELCKKLTEIGFPEATSCHWRKDSKGVYDTTFWPWNDESFVCPSVMEMLDVIPRIKIDWYSYGINIWITQSRKYIVWYRINDKNKISSSFQSWTLPNALAEMILWLHENNYISFYTIPKELIEKALALTGKSAERLWLVGWFDYANFCYYLLSPEFIEKYTETLLPKYEFVWGYHIDEWISDYATAIYEYQKWDSEPLKNLLSKI